MSTGSPSSPSSPPQKSSSDDVVKKDSSSVNKEEEAIGICTTTKERFNVPLTYDCTDVFITPQKWTEWPVILELFLIFFYSATYLLGILPKWVCLMMIFCSPIFVMIVLPGKLYLLEIGL